MHLMITNRKSKADRHLLGLKDLPREDIEAILERASYWEKETGVSTLLQGRFIANMFFENSTRTRFSFEVAEKRLGAEVLNFSAAVSSVQKGESIADTVRTLESMGIHAGVIRLTPAGVLNEIAARTNIPLINAGDGCNEHPTQALLDMYTLRQHYGSLAGLRVAIIGDIRHSRVARSNLWGMSKLGMEVVFCAPEEMRAPELDVRYVDIDEALQADVVMPLRLQLERHETGILASAEQYRRQYGITAERAARMKDHAVIMHPAPVNRNVEIDDEVVEQPNSLIFTQIKNGVPIRMAVIERALLQ